MNIKKFEQKEKINNYQKIDCQERSPIIENLYQLIKSTQSSLVISIEAPWGCGKTFFTKYCESEFQKKGGFTIYFNAWENDYSEDPFIVFYDEILKVIKEEKEKNPGFLDIYNRYKKVGMEILKYSLPLIIKLITNGLIDIRKIGPLFRMKINNDDISSMLTNFAEEKISAYKNKQKSIIEFKKILTEFVEKIQEEGGEKKVFTIFIDELDRCRPNYAIELIENIKHLFNIDGIAFILSLDIDQLKESIKILYGNMDSEGYLKRFFDYRIILPEPQLISYINYLYREYDFENILSKPESGNIKKWFVFLTKPFNWSLRDLEKMVYEFNIVITTAPSSVKEMPALLIILIILKHKRIDLYKGLHESEFPISDLDDLYGFCNNMTDYLDCSASWIRLRAYIMLDLLDQKALNDETDRLMMYLSSRGKSNQQMNNAEAILNVIRDSFKRIEYQNILNTLLSQIDFVSEIYKNSA
jgi:hypothetical protein